LDINFLHFLADADTSAADIFVLGFIKHKLGYPCLARVYLSLFFFIFLSHCLSSRLIPSFFMSYSLSLYVSFSLSPPLSVSLSLSPSLSYGGKLLKTFIPINSTPAEEDK
jgi:hypothetical protein